MIGIFGKKLRTRKHKCPFCDAWYERLSLSERPHPQIKELPCFTCAKKGAHQTDQGLDILSRDMTVRRFKKGVLHG